MYFKNEIVLEDKMVLLRPLQMDDQKHLLPYSLQEPSLWKYSLQTAAGEENMKCYIINALEMRNKEDSYPFIVFDKRVQRYIGSTRYYDVRQHHHTLQLGYTWYGKAYQRTGINRHCKYLLLQYAFEKLNMQRVEFRADNNNARSIQAMKDLGCTVEGILRKNFISNNGSRRDSIVLSILKNEWEKMVKEGLKSKMY